MRCIAWDQHNLSPQEILAVQNQQCGLATAGWTVPLICRAQLALIRIGSHSAEPQSAVTAD
jgi:hypothetical protein